MWNFLDISWSHLEFLGGLRFTIDNWCVFRCPFESQRALGISWLYSEFSRRLSKIICALMVQHSLISLFYGSPVNSNWVQLVVQILFVRLVCLLASEDVQLIIIEPKWAKLTTSLRSSWAKHGSDSLSWEIYRDSERFKEIPKNLNYYQGLLRPPRDCQGLLSSFRISGLGLSGINIVTIETLRET